MTTFIEANNISKSFGTQRILDNISFTIKEGSISGLLGPNGSGKTTMIRILNGVINADNGYSSVGGFHSMEQGNEIRKISGVVTESTALYHEMNAVDNLKFFSEIYGVDDEDRIRFLINHFELNDYKMKKVGTYSTGMKKRVALAKALLHRPKVLFLDEPTNGLDPEGIKSVMESLKKLNQDEGITILICSHVLQQLESICNSYIFINQGKMIEQGTRKELEEKYIREFELLVETGLQPNDETYYGKFPYERISDSLLKFSVTSKDDISPLLKNILEDSWVHSSELTNRSLESLYFKIRGGQNE